MSELSNGSWNFQSLHQDSLLSLEENVLGPSDESGEILSGKDIATNPEGLGVGLEHSVQLFLRSLFTLLVPSFTLWLYKNITKRSNISSPLYERYSLIRF